MSPPVLYSHSQFNRGFVDDDGFDPFGHVPYSAELTRRHSDRYGPGAGLGPRLSAYHNELIDEWEDVRPKNQRK